MSNLVLVGPVLRFGVADSEDDVFVKGCKLIHGLPDLYIPLVDASRETKLGYVVSFATMEGTNELYAEAHIDPEFREFVAKAVRHFGLRFAINGTVTAEKRLKKVNRISEVHVKSISLCSRNVDYYLPNLCVK